jgi:cyclase
MRLRGYDIRRVVVLGALLLVGATSLGVVSGQQGEMVVEVEQLEANLYVLRGGGGNSAAFVTSNGVVLVDTKMAGWGQPLIDAIGELTSNPIRTIINTHAHFDHTSGNVEFPASVEFVAHENAKTLMEEWNPVTGFPGSFPDVFETSGGQGLPGRTFANRLTLGSGADQVDLYYFGRGHTGGDTWVVFPALRTMHAGDMFPGKQVPIMDASNGGSGVEYADTLRLALATITDVDTIITGHSTQMTLDDMEEMADFVSGLVAAAKLAKARGQSAEEFAESWSPAPRFRTGFAASPPARLLPYVQVIYDELDAM